MHDSGAKTNYDVLVVRNGVMATSTKVNGKKMQCGDMVYIIPYKRTYYGQFEDDKKHGYGIYEWKMDVSLQAGGTKANNTV